MFKHTVRAAEQLPKGRRPYSKYEEDLFPRGDVVGQGRVMAESVITTRGLLLHTSTRPLASPVSIRVRGASAAPSCTSLL